MAPTFVAPVEFHNGALRRLLMPVGTDLATARSYYETLAQPNQQDSPLARGVFCERRRHQPLAPNIHKRDSIGSRRRKHRQGFPRAAYGSSSHIPHRDRHSSVADYLRLAAFGFALLQDKRADRICMFPPFDQSAWPLSTLP